jgi:hypothetical protein
MKKCFNFEKENLAVATAILSDVDRHGGPGSLPVVWAERVIAKAIATKVATESPADASGEEAA